MMLAKTEGRPAIPRDGRHCDLCGCSQPAVRCDKCGRQIFCLSCDDMYHRHPKRRFHLRKAVDTTPPTTQARPVLPAKAHATLGGDPSKMPLPPPRKKKPGKAASFFDTFRRRSPSADSSPPLPKKEYSWTDRFGNIKKFMSNRPLPPLPDSNGVEEDSPQNIPSTKHDLSFIHKKVDEKPPQLPQRSLKPNEFTRGPHDKENQPTNGMREVRNGTLNPSHMSRNNGFGEENQWNNRTTEHHNPNTLMRQPGYMYPGSPANMSASATDLHNMEQAGLPPHHYPHYPSMNPHMPPPHYPHYPMYPQYPGNFPGGYFGNSFANLSSQPATTTDGDHSDHSDATTSRPGKKYQFRKRAKRSQSVLVDRMAYPGQFYPFGPFPPGYGPWGGGGPFPPLDQPPPSPAGSVRSLSRVGRTRRRKKTTSEDEEEFSVSSSPLSRPKSSSSSGRQKALPVVTSSSEDEYEEAQRSRVPRKDSDPKKISSPIPRSPPIQQKKFFPHKQKKGETLARSSDAEEVQQNVAQVAKPPPPSPKENYAGQSNHDQASSSTSPAPWIPAGKWECVHCTYINPAGSRICQVCCKTASVEGAGPPPAGGSRPGSSGRRQSASSEQSCSSPEKRIEEEEDVDTKRSKQDMAVLNSALDEAEKEISRGLEELMKLKEDFPPNKPTPSPQNKPEAKLPRTPPPGKPVYKSSGKMRNSSSILDKLTTPTAKSTATSTETQTAQTFTSDRVMEARRGSTSSTTSDAYNSPIAQSPVLERTSQGAVGKGPAKKDTSIQTQTDDLVDFERRRAEDEAYFGRTSNGYGFRYGDIRMDTVTSPVPSVYDRGGYHHPVMQRSHSRASLFTGRMNDLGPLDYGLGPSPMYRSVSRSSLTGDYPENSFADFHNLRKPAYYLSMEELVERRRQESIRAQGLELVRMIREAEQQGFTADDIQVALHNCGTNQTPVEWLQENWRQLAEQVIALSANYANEKRENDVGVVSDIEAREALRLHKGNVWPAVTECVESRQRKFLELKARGKFCSKDITDTLSANQGDVELAYAKLTKSSSKPFLMRIWGAGEGAQNQDGAIPPKVTPTAKNLQDFYFKDRDDIQSDGTWDDDEVEWDEDYDEEEEEEEEQGDLEDLQTCHEDVVVKTPDSDKSDYCDAFGSNTLERNTSLPSSSNETDTKLARRGSFLSKLAGLKRNDKDSRRSSQTDFESPESSKVVKDSQENLASSFSSDQSKSYNPISVIKNTISAIRDTVGGSKSEKKLPCAAPERRTIVVKGQIPQELSSIASGGVNGITLTSAKPLKDCEPLLSETAEVTHVVSEGVLNKNECKELPPLTSSNVNVNKKLTASPSDAGNKNREAISTEKIGSPSHQIGVSEHNSSQSKQASKLQETATKKETDIISQKYKSIDDKGSTFKSQENSSQPSETGKISLKTNLENMEKDLKSEQKTQELVKDTKGNVTKENIQIFSPKTSSSPNKKLLPIHILKEEQKEKITTNLVKEPLENEQSLENKVNFVDVGSTSSNTFDKISEEKNEIKSENEATTEIPYSNDQNITSVEICERITTPTGCSKIQNKPELESNASEQNLETKDTISAKPDRVTNEMSNEVNILSSFTSASNNKSDSFKTQVAASKVIKSDNKAGGLKHVLSDVRTEHKDSHLTNILTNNALSTTQPKFSPSIDRKATALEGYSNIQKTADTSSLENEESQVIFSKENISEMKENSKSPYGTSENNDTQDFIYSNEHSIERQDNFQNIPKQNTFVSNTNKLVDEKFHETGVLLEGAELLLIDNVDTSLADTPSHNKPREHDSVAFESMEPIHSSTFKRSFSNQSVEGKVDAQMISETACMEKMESSLTNKSEDAAAIITTNEALTSETASFDLEIPSQMVEMCAGTINDSAKQGLKVADNKISKEIKGVLCTQITSKVKTSEQLNRAHQATTIPSTSSIATAEIMEVNSSSLEANSLSFLEASPQIEMVSDSVSDPTSQPKYNVPNQTSIEQNEEQHSKSSIQEASTSVSSLPASNIISSYQPSFIQEDISNDSVSLENGIPQSSQKTLILATSVHSASAPSASLPEASIPSHSTIVTSAPVTTVSAASVPTASIPSASLPTVSTTDASDSDGSSAPVTTVSAAPAHTASILSSPISTPSIPTASSFDPSATVAPSSDASVSSLPITSALDASVKTDSISTVPSLVDGDFSAPVAGHETLADNDGSDEEDDGSEPITPPSPVDALRHRFEGLIEEGGVMGPIRPASPFRRMSFRSRKEAIALERTRDTSAEKPWFLPKPKLVEAKKPLPKRSLKQQMETERKVRKMVADRKVRTYRKAEVVVQLMDLNFEEEEAIQAANECSTFEMALSYLQQECLLCTGHFPVSHIISMVHCPHKACRDCIRAYFTVQIRDRNIMELLCPFCNEPDISDEDIAQDYFNHLDMMLKKLVDPEIHELFQRKLRDRVLMRDPSFRWCSKCSSGFLAMENLKRLVCPDCNAVTCASCRRPEWPPPPSNLDKCTYRRWEKEHQGMACEAFAALKDGNDPEAQAVSLAKLLTEDGIDCPRCHFRYALAKGGCMHFRCIQCQHDFCSGCSRPFKMGQKCGVSEFCAKLGLHAHHPRNCLFYLRDKDPEDLQRLLDLSEVKYDRDPPGEGDEEDEGGCARCQVMEQKETSDGMVDDFCGKETEKGFAGLCRLHYVEYLGQLVNKHQVDPIQIFENDDLELVLRRANIRLPPKRYRETDESYREKLVNLIHEELPLDKMDGS